MPNGLQHGDKITVISHGRSLGTFVVGTGFNDELFLFREIDEECYNMNLLSQDGIQWYLQFTIEEEN